MAEEDERVEPRRSARLALMEISLNESSHETPNKHASADEMVIIQRGPRKKPLMWSPVELRTPATRKTVNDMQTSSGELLPKKPSLNSKIRRRLILSPTKNPGELGYVIARKLQCLPMFSQELAHSN